jgi:hypothetical protein
MSNPGAQRPVYPPNTANPGAARAPGTYAAVPPAGARVVVTPGTQQVGTPARAPTASAAPVRPFFHRVSSITTTIYLFIVSFAPKVVLKGKNEAFFSSLRYQVLAAALWLISLILVLLESLETFLTAFETSHFSQYA